MVQLTILQRRILAVLEEAGEEHLSSLINSVAVLHGLPVEIDAMRIALSSLIVEGFIAISQFRDKVSRHCVAMHNNEAISLLQRLEIFLAWSADDGLWTWRKDCPGAEVVLTDAGTTMSRQVLSEDGWPQTPLDKHDG